MSSKKPARYTLLLGLIAFVVGMLLVSIITPAEITIPLSLVAAGLLSSSVLLVFLSIGLAYFRADLRLHENVRKSKTSIKSIIWYIVKTAWIAAVALVISHLLVVLIFGDRVSFILDNTHRLLPILMLEIWVLTSLFFSRNSEGTS